MVEVPIPFSLRFGHGPFGAAIPLQHREAQPQPAMHSCYLRSTDKRLYHSHHGLVTDLLPTRIEPWSSAGEASVLATTPPGLEVGTFKFTTFFIYVFSYLSNLMICNLNYWGGGGNSKKV